MILSLSILYSAAGFVWAAYVLRGTRAEARRSGYRSVCAYLETTPLRLALAVLVLEVALWPVAAWISRGTRPNLKAFQEMEPPR